MPATRSTMAADLEPSAAPVMDLPGVASARLREIYIQASRLFVERGYEGTSMSDIAEAVKITKAGLYHFVKGKEDLLFTIMSFGMDELEAEVVNPARHIDNPGERLEFIVRAHLRNIGRGIVGEGNPVTLVVDEPWGLSGEKHQTISRRKRAYYNLIRETLAELKQQGRTRPDLDLTVASHSIIGIILWTARWRRPTGPLTTEEVCRQVVGLVIGGVLSDQANGAALPG